MPQDTEKMNPSAAGSSYDSDQSCAQQLEQHQQQKQQQQQQREEPQPQRQQQQSQSLPYRERDEHLLQQTKTDAGASQQNKGSARDAADNSGNTLKEDHPDAKGPAGGYDSSTIPHAPPGFDVKITFHRATHLPMADLSTLSSDPYVSAELKTNLPSRHKEDPPLKFRSHTVFKNTEPVWDSVWKLAHVPASGFEMKARIYDEDANDRDDRLGNVHINVHKIDENWEGIKNEPYKIKKKTGSKRAYLIRAVAVGVGQRKQMHGDLYVSVEVTGRSQGNEGGRTYTIGPNYWYKHFSPLLGRIANSRANAEDDEQEPSEENQQGQAPNGETAGNPDVSHDSRGRPNNNENVDGACESSLFPSTTKKNNRSSSRSNSKPGRYQFQANQFQLSGPVPAELYHRYVEFRPIITSLFTSKGLRGLILHKALHHQHGMVYNFSATTKHGVFEHPSPDMTRQFLDMVHHDEGGRIHTYVITLDGLFRFTETGKEFGIDFLSKHTMHSDASIYIAYSGEFFIRRLKNPHKEPPEQAEAEASERTDSKDKSVPESYKMAAQETQNETHPPSNLSHGPPKSPPPRDPQWYELIIDNDSGTYRPNAALLPLLRKFLHANFPGLKITTLDCQQDADLMNKLKDQQRERKKAEGKHVVYTQASMSDIDSSSMSSSDEERLEARWQEEQEEDGEKEEGSGTGHQVHRLAEAVLPFTGNAKVRDGLQGNLGAQKKAREGKEKIQH